MHGLRCCMSYACGACRWHWWQGSARTLNLHIRPVTVHVAAPVRAHAHRLLSWPRHFCRRNARLHTPLLARTLCLCAPTDKPKATIICLK